MVDLVGTDYDRVIRQWDENRLSVTDAEKTRLVYGTKSLSTAPNDGDNRLVEKVPVK